MCRGNTVLIKCKNRKQGRVRSTTAWGHPEDARRRIIAGYPGGSKTIRKALFL